MRFKMILIRSFFLLILIEVKKKTAEFGEIKCILVTGCK